MNEGRLGAPVGRNEIGSFWPIFFWSAALFNFLIGLSGMLAPVPSVDERIIGLLVFCFGVVYAVVARNPLRYAAVLWAGVIGNLGVVGLMAQGVLNGEGGILGIIILSIDLVFAIGFLAFLITRPSET
ncbi:hypothetical protein [Erythrobacter sp. F6033]|uniref:hypothetical protein n=1 Tax=Erythrobacter sp. F6033 TaxID=2926401 RepID=UPI001FF53CA1|nr:hypothetical protein [Erythrobacter sp. F6033]MCK0127453.1 hypothetical protein [Erythrobacter sp. F6033]